MLPHDPVPWLMAQAGLPALRARRLLGLSRAGDEHAATSVARALAQEQRPDGSFDGSPMKTAGVLNFLDDLQTADAGAVVTAGASYLLSVLESQPGYERAKRVSPGGLTEECDLCGFFGPYQHRSLPEVLTWGAREMNSYREYEPLLGPKAPVRDIRTSSRDRVGPGSCFAWGLSPLAYAIETLCRAGHAADARLKPAINALLGAQRNSGGWCRGLSGDPSCTIHAVRVLGAHPELRRSRHAESALHFLRATQQSAAHTKMSRWSGSRRFAIMQSMAAFDLPVAREILHDALGAVTRGQRKNGTFGHPCPVERVCAVLVAAKAIA